MIDTETRIKNATTDLLLKDGNFGLSMADIAEKSKVSRTVIHYYFRSKENLLSIVNREIIKSIVIPKYSVLLVDSSLIDKVEKYICESENRSKLYPYLDVYFISQYQSNIIFQDYFKSIEDAYQSFISQIKICIDEKKLNYSSPSCFLTDLFTLTNCSFIYGNFFTSSHSSCKKLVKSALLKQRKDNILNFFFVNN